MVAAARVEVCPNHPERARAAPRAEESSGPPILYPSPLVWPTCACHHLTVPSALKACTQCTPSARPAIAEGKISIPRLAQHRHLEHRPSLLLAAPSPATDDPFHHLTLVLLHRPSAPLLPEPKGPIPFNGAARSVFPAAKDTSPTITQSGLLPVSPLPPRESQRPGGPRRPLKIQSPPPDQPITGAPLRPMPDTVECQWG
jgi:hypothetical protein